jgi:hypothetical protein
VLFAYVLTVVKSQKKETSWERRAARVVKKRNERKILRIELEAISPRGRPSLKWEDNMKMNITDDSLSFIINLTQRDDKGKRFI